MPGQAEGLVALTFLSLLVMLTKTLLVQKKLANITLKTYISVAEGRRKQGGVPGD